jgi:hypothetical protein
MSTDAALFAPQCISWAVVGVPMPTPPATMARNTAQLIPTSRYVAGDVAKDERGLRTARGGGSGAPGGRSSGSGDGE